MQIVMQVRTFVLVWLLVVASFVAPGFAQEADAGLPGPVSRDAFQQYDKVATNCDKCKDAESAYHTQVDVYDAARAAYDAQVVKTRAVADQFLAARTKYVTLNEAYEAASAAAWDWLVSDKPVDSDYYRLRDEADFALEDADAAQSALAESRSALNSALRQLEAVRLNALAEMRQAGRLMSAMFRCEFSCDISELDLDEPDLISTPPTGEGAEPVIPTPENFIGIVAKCAACQPLAENVNSIRSKRRAFAVDAQDTAESLAANRQELARLQQQKAALEAEQRQLFSDLFKFFPPQTNDETQSAIDEAFDHADREEFDRQLVELDRKRTQNAADVAGFERLVAQLEAGLQAALADHQAQSALLAAAEKALAECEAKCATDEREPIIDPFVDPDYPQPENVDPILAECAKCQPIADELVRTSSERRSVAQEIQDVVWLLKGRRASLEKWEAEYEALQKEELELGQLLIWGEEKGVNEAEVMKLLFEIEDKTTKLLIDMLWAEDEITRLEADLAANMAKYEALSKLIGELRQKLAECEKTCGDEEAGDDNRIGLYDPAFPAPESFIGVLAKCAECQPIADQLNIVLSERYMLARDIQSTAERLKHNSGVLSDLEAELVGLLAREEALNPISHDAVDEEGAAAATRELNEIDARRHTVESDIAYFKEANGKDQTALNEMLEAHVGLDEKIADLQAQLAECEKNCGNGTEDGSGVSVGGGEDGGGAGDPRFASTDCVPCEAIVGQLNDAIGSVITTEAELAAAREKMAELKAEVGAKEAAKKVAQDTFAAAMLEKARLEAAGADASAQQDIIDTNVDAASDLLTDIDDLELEILNQEDVVEGLEEQLAEWQSQVNEQRERLAECEKQCADASDEGSGVATGERQTEVPANDPRFATSDCAPCEVIVGQLNDAIGSVITTEANLTEAKAKQEQLQAELVVKEAAKKAAQDAFADAMVEKSKLEEAGADTSEQQALIDDNVQKAVDLLSEIEEIELDLLNQNDAVEALELQLAQWQQEVNVQRERLAVCEKQCADAEGEGETGMGTGAPVEEEEGNDTPFASTDCVPCQFIVDQLNDAIGSVITTEGNLSEAQAKLAALEAEEAEKSAAKQDAENAFGAAMLEKARLDAAGTDSSALAELIETNVDLASDLLTELDDIELELLTQREAVESLTQQVAMWKHEVSTKRVLLETCEKQCADDAEEIGMGQDPDVGETEFAVAQNGSAGQFSMGKSQPEVCREGQVCGFSLSATNDSDGQFAGPIFMTESMRVSAGGHGDGVVDWQCSPAASGQSMCIAQVADVAPGQTMNFQVSANLPNRVAGGAQNCAAIALASEPRMLTQMVQAGLAQRGYDVGGADGIAGPRTNAAVAAFAADTGAEFDQSDSTETYIALFGAPPEEGEGSSACIALDIDRPVTASQPPPAAQPDAAEEPAPQVDLPTPTFEIRIDQGREHPSEQEEEHRGMPGMGGVRIELPGIGGIGL